MTTFVLEINPETREELYSDTSELFVGFIFIEALYIILGTGRPGIGALLDQIDCPLDLPEGHPDLGLAEQVASEVDASIEYLLDVTERLNQENGILLSEEYYSYGSDYYDAIQTKLIDAIISIEDSNDPSRLHALAEVFENPALATGFGFKVMHYLDRIVVLLVPANTMLSDVKPGSALAKLLSGGDPEGNAAIWDEESVLQMSEEATMAAINRMFGIG